jgi:hypothetical protein
MAVRRVQEQPLDERMSSGTRGPGESSTSDRSITARGVLAEVDALFSKGDFEGALSVASAILRIDPDSHEAASYAESCRLRLRMSYAARLGSLLRVVNQVMSQERVRSLALDHRAGFVLACVDGFSTVEEILDVAGMPELDALRVLVDLFERGVIETH